jgi:hypothetical protein
VTDSSTHNSDPEADAIAEARLFLGDDAEGFDIDELLGRLLDCRNGAHPDRFSDADAKHEASVRFKRAQKLIEKLDRRRQRQLIKSSSTDLVIAEDARSRELRHRLQINASEERIEGLKEKLDELQRKNRALDEKLRSDRDASRSLELEKLRKMYEPSRSRILGVAISVILGGILAAILQVDQIAAVLKHYSPLSPSAFNIGVFAICIAAIAMTGSNYLKHLEYRYMMRQVCTTRFATGFLSFARSLKSEFHDKYGRSLIREFAPGDDYHLSELSMWLYKHKERVAEIDENFEDNLRSTKEIFSRFLHNFEVRQGDEAFDEHTVLQYLQNYFYEADRAGSGQRSNRVTRIRQILSIRQLRRDYRTSLGLFSNEAMDHLKDAFILHLIDRELVDDPKAAGLVHRFRIR